MASQMRMSSASERTREREAESKSKFGQQQATASACRSTTADLVSQMTNASSSLTGSVVQPSRPMEQDSAWPSPTRSFGRHRAPGRSGRPLLVALGCKCGGEEFRLVEAPRVLQTGEMASVSRSQRCDLHLPSRRMTCTEQINVPRLCR